MAINAVEAAVSEFPGMDHRARIEHFAGDYWPEGIENDGKYWLEHFIQ